MIKSLRQARITDGLPRVLARQEWVIALSEALGLALGKTLDYTDESQIYTRLDTAPETVLDVLAVDGTSTRPSLCTGSAQREPSA